MGNHLSRSKSNNEDVEGKSRPRTQEGKDKERILGTHGGKGKEDISISKRSEGADSGYDDQNELSSSMSSLIGLRDNMTIRKHFRYLKTELEDLRKLVDKCMEDDDLNQDDSDDIFIYKTRRQSVDAFIRKLLRFKPEAFNRFLTYLNESQQKHIADTLMKDNKYPADLPEFRKTETQMKASIVMNLEAVCDALEPEKDADFFVVYLVFSIDEYESIISHRYRRLQAEEMVSLIIKHIHKSYPVLIQVFREASNSFMLNVLDNVTVQENQDELNARAIETFRRESRSLNCGCYRHLGHFNMQLKLIAIGSSRTTDQHERVIQINEAMARINNDLRSLGCKLVCAEEGSIIIYLLNYGRSFQSRGRIGDDISKLLALIFLHPAVAKFGSYEGLRFNVSVKSGCLESTKYSEEIMKETVEQNMDYLIEELGALTFIRHKNARKIFKKREIDSVLKCEPPGRENRMRKLLSLILSKGKPALRFFKMVLKDECMFNVLGRISTEKLQPSCTCSGYCMELLDEMSPLLILDEYRAMRIDNTVSMHVNNSKSRKDQCLIILRDVFEQEPAARQKLVHILERNYPDFILGHSCRISSGLNGVTNWRTIYEGEHDIKEKDAAYHDTVSTSGSRRFLMPGGHTMRRRSANCDYDDFEQVEPTSNSTIPPYVNEPEISCADGNEKQLLAPNDLHSTKDLKAYSKKTNEIPMIVITEYLDDINDPSKGIVESTKSSIDTCRDRRPPGFSSSTKSEDSGFYDSQLEQHYK